jgi:hypothetical protein
MTIPQDLKTIGLTPFSIHSDQALSHVSDLLHVAKLLAEDAAMERGSDRYAWASHYLQEMSKAVIDDVVKVLGAPCNAG